MGEANHELGEFAKFGLASERALEAFDDTLTEGKPNADPGAVAAAGEERLEQVR